MIRIVNSKAIKVSGLMRGMNRVRYHSSLLSRMRANLGAPDARFELLEELGIAGGRLEGGIHANQAITPFTPDK
jgi:hypothetical protein